MDQIWVKVRQRLEHEPPQVHAGMGQDEIHLIAYDIVEQEKVQVDQSRGISCRSNAPHRLLDRLKL
jgi:hypothetical protein